MRGAEGALLARGRQQDGGWPGGGGLPQRRPGHVVPARAPRKDCVCSADPVPPSFLPQGTVIRVFSAPEGQKLFEFRRGVKR